MMGPGGAGLMTGPLLNALALNRGGGAVTPPDPGSTWILATNIWNDNGVWDDAAAWND